jgi:hypothetical protein
MTISFTAASGGSGWTVFYSDTGVTTFDGAAATGAMPEFSGSFGGSVYDTELALSATRFRAPLGNLKSAMTLRYDVGYGSVQAAARSKAAIKAALENAVFHLKVDYGSGYVEYYPNAVLAPNSGYGFKQTGCSMQHTVSFTSDDVTTTDPGP